MDGALWIFANDAEVILIAACGKTVKVLPSALDVFRDLISRNDITLCETVCNCVLLFGGVDQTHVADAMTKLVSTTNITFQPPEDHG